MKQTMLNSGVDLWKKNVVRCWVNSFPLELFALYADNEDCCNDAKAGESIGADVDEIFLLREISEKAAKNHAEAIDEHMDNNGATK